MLVDFDVREQQWEIVDMDYGQWIFSPEAMV